MSGISFIGTMKKASFDVSGEEARIWLTEPSNPNGERNAAVLAPWSNGKDITGRPTGRWIIDFADRTAAEAKYFVGPYAHVSTKVLPERLVSGSPSERKYWWRLARRAPAMLAAIRALPRYIATPRNGRHRLFVWLPSQVIPDGQLVVVARDDDTTFGILHSRFHELWALGLCTWLGVGNDPRYTPSTTFETFPFPDGLTPKQPAATYIADPRALAIAQAAEALATARDRWLNPPELVVRMPEVVAGFPDRLMPKDAAAEATLRKRTLTALYNQRGKPEGAWLDTLHRVLDDAVAKAYGWATDIATDEALRRLLELNLARSVTREAN